MQRDRSDIGEIDRLFKDGTIAGRDEGALLERVSSDPEELALSAIVERHGMVRANDHADFGLIAPLVLNSPGSPTVDLGHRVPPTGRNRGGLTQPIFKKKRIVPVSLTAEIKRSSTGGGVPTGAVAFELFAAKGKKIQAQTHGKVSVKRSQAKLTVKPSSVLKKSITIVYGGDTNFRGTTVTAPKLTQAGLKLNPGSQPGAVS